MTLLEAINKMKLMGRPYSWVKDYDYIQYISCVYCNEGFLIKFANDAAYCPNCEAREDYIN